MILEHRPFEQGDADAICSFPASAEELFFMFPKAVYPLTPEQLIRAAAERHNPTVALVDGRVAGYINLVEARPRHYCALGNLVVDPAVRRKGVAQFLVKVMVETAVAQYAARFVRASCFSHNKGACNLYHKLGFRPSDLAQRLSPEGEPVLLVHMYLQIKGS